MSQVHRRLETAATTSSSVSPSYALRYAYACGRWRIARSRYHPPKCQRITALAWHADVEPVALSGCTGGVLQVWDIAQNVAHQRRLHASTLHAIATLPQAPRSGVVTAGEDGRVLYTDWQHIDTSIDSAPVRLYDATADGALTCLASMPSHQLLIVGDQRGTITLLDARLPLPDDCRQRRRAAQCLLHAHRPGTRIHAVAVDTAALAHRFATGGADRTVKLWDVRRLDGARSMCLTQLAHPRMVSAVCFAPHTGTRLLTTCQDNRLRVIGQLDRSDLHTDTLPLPALVHSHRLQRFSSAFRAAWDPKDATDELVVCGSALPMSSALGTTFPESPLFRVDVLSTRPHAVVNTDGDARPAWTASLTDPMARSSMPLNLPHATRPWLLSATAHQIHWWAVANVGDE